MLLTVPQRTVADTGSFPVDPLGVAEWLNSLEGLTSAGDAREVYRGLKHSNRLHNDVDRRRAVLSCFTPVLHELHDQLSELTQAQPLPLTHEFAQSAKLRNSLLREEVFAFKLLLTDSKKPIADDARRAMHALARQAESMIKSYRDMPIGILQDAHQLYVHAKEHQLLDKATSSEHSTFNGIDLNGEADSDNSSSLIDHYRYILLLHVADLRQQRVRQLPLLLEFLRENAKEIHFRKYDSTLADGTLYAIDLDRTSIPEPARSLIPGDISSREYFSLKPVVKLIEKRIKSIQPDQSSILGSDTLERQSLRRLHLSLTRSRKRRSARLICHESSNIYFGYKEITTALMLGSTSSENQNGGEASPTWTIKNRSPQGCMISHSNCRAGRVQVGDIVSIGEHTSTPDEASTKTNIGIVRWMHSSGENKIEAGVEFLARKVLPVSIKKQNAEKDIAEKAMIIACKVEQKVLQTILLPAYLYHTGDNLEATQGDKRRQLQLDRCLQTNGLFSHFSLA